MVKKITIYNANGSQTLIIHDIPTIIEITNGQKTTHYQLVNTRCKQILGRKHQMIAEGMIQAAKNIKKPEKTQS